MNLLLLMEKKKISLIRSYSLCSVVVLDHHKTTLESLGSKAFRNGNVVMVIDMDRSGATISFDYFKEKLLQGDTSNVENNKKGNVAEFDRVSRLFEYIEDADLWRWRLPNSKEFSSGLKDLNIEFDARLNPTLFQQVNFGILSFSLYLSNFMLIGIIL